MRLREKRKKERKILVINCLTPGGLKGTVDSVKERTPKNKTVSYKKMLQRRQFWLYNN